MEQIGKVLSIEDGMVTLEVKRVSACGADCQSCHSTCEEKSEIISMVNELQAQVGDYIEIGIDSRFVLTSLLKLYGIPLLLFVISVLVSIPYFGHIPEKGQLYSFLVGLLSFVFSFLILKQLDRNNEKYRPKMIRIL